MLYIPDGAKQERDKYQEIWEKVPEYRSYSPGKENVERFMKVINPKLGSRLIDLGCGEGVAGLEFEKLGLDVWYLDITKAAKKEEIRDNRFMVSPLWGDWRKFPQFDYGFCCDVLEHIPQEYTMLCLDKILENCRISWLQISLIEDSFGKVLGQPLHLTVRSFDWWLIRLGTLGKVIEARDLLDTGLYVVKR